MKFSAVLSLAVCFVVLAQSVTPLPDIVEEVDFYRRAAGAQPKESLTRVEYHPIVKPTIPNRTSKGGVVGMRVEGPLEPFGTIAGDCTTNWADGKSLGGGFSNSVTNPFNKIASMGVGGGYNYTPELMDVGAGISAFGQKANYHLDITKEGKITISFDASKTLDCKPDPKKPNGTICTA